MPSDFVVRHLAHLWAQPSRRRTPAGLVVPRRRCAAIRYVLPAVLLAAVACGGGGLAPLGPGESAADRPAGMAVRQVARRGALGYRSALLGERLWLAVELGVRFELVVRQLAGGRARDLGRLDLGPPDWDVTALAVAQGVPRAWVGSMDGTVRIIDLDRLRIERTWRIGHAVTAVAVSPRGRQVAVATDSGVLCLRRARDGALLQCVVAHQARIAALDHAGDRLITGAWDGSAAVWSVPSLRRLEGFSIEGSVNAVALSPDGRRIAVAGSAAPPSPAARADPRGAGRGWLAVHRLGSGHGTGPRIECAGHLAAVVSVGWAAGADQLLSGSWDRTARLWALEGATCLELARERLDGHAIQDLAIDRRGGTVAASLWVTGLEQPSAVVLDVLYPRRR